MRKLFGCVIVLLLIIGIKGVVLAGSTVESNGYVLTPDITSAGDISAQKSMSLCDNFGGTWKINIKKRKITGTYTTNGGCNWSVTGKKTGKKLDMKASGSCSQHCNTWHQSVVTKQKGSATWVGTTAYGGGTCEGSGIATTMSKCN